MGYVTIVCVCAVFLSRCVLAIWKFSKHASFSLAMISLGKPKQAIKKVYLARANVRREEKTKRRVNDYQFACYTKIHIFHLHVSLFLLLITFIRYLPIKCIVTNIYKAQHKRCVRYTKYPSIFCSILSFRKENHRIGMNACAHMHTLSIVPIHVCTLAWAKWTTAPNNEKRTNNNKNYERELYEKKLRTFCARRLFRVNSIVRCC